MTGPQEVLAFWFGEEAKARWFEKDPAFDAEIRRRFGPAAAAAAEGRLSDWERAPESCLALVILLDQLPRNIHRDSPRAYANDAKARAVAGDAIARGLDRRVPPERRIFFYLPFEHSEHLADQRRAVELVRQLADALSATAPDEAATYLDYAIRHEQVIARFGRFPHRNAILGRPSTPEEEAFLKQPGSAF